MWIDVVAGIAYATVAVCVRYLVSAESLANTWTGGYYVWYSYVALPFNCVVLASVLFDVKTELTMPMFYASRYLDYVSTFEILRNKRYDLFNLDVFHHSTVPTLIRLSWDDKIFFRFAVFCVGIGSSVYVATKAGTDAGNGYLENMSAVQWTQYAVVTVHTIRTSSKWKRFMFLLYAGLFTGLILQFFLF